MQAIRAPGDTPLYSASVAVLLSEGVSLTARETLTVLGASGRQADVLTNRAVTIARFSRWTRRCIAAPAPSHDPLGYLAEVSRLIDSGRYEAVLPTHEQAWLFAAGRHLLPEQAPIALAPAAAFDRVQGKLDFARLCDQLAVPHPRWWPVAERPPDAPYPHWVKAQYGTAGRSVRLVADAEHEERAVRELSRPGDPLMGQIPAPGQYGQVQALFERGRLIAVHTSVQIGTGAGGSAAARLSVDHPAAREHAERIGAELAWHGGLTLDYFHIDGQPQFIECNPRTVEPGNAAAAGVDLPASTITLSSGRPAPAQPVVGRAGVRTRSALALALGAAERENSRLAVARVVVSCALSRGDLGRAAEVLTPVCRDQMSLIQIAVTAGRLLARPSDAGRIAAAAVEDYSISPSVIARVRP